MKLRNKKTGEIKDVESIGHADSIRKSFGYQVTLSWNVMDHLDTCKTYKTLAELNEEWEDWEPAEPLIKDEKIRKAVREWAGFNGTYPIYREDRCTLSYNHSPRIEFKDIAFADLDDRAYTIAELCGEEEG